MKTSCIQHPENNPLIIIRSWQLLFCDGNHCSAALLSVFEYWHNIKLEIRRKNTIANDIAEMHKDKRFQDETLLQFHNLNDLHKHIQFLYSKNTIQKSLEFLENKGVISIHSNPNPRYRFDRTRYFKFNPEIINHWLKGNNQLHWHPKLKNKLEHDEEINDDILEPNFIEESTHQNENIDQSKLIDRIPKNNLRFNKSDESSPNFDRAITKDYLPRIQTEKSAAKESNDNLLLVQVLEDVSSASTQRLNEIKLPKLNEEEEIIRTTLTENQLLYVKEKTSQLLPLFSKFSFNELEDHIINELLDCSFSQCEKKFLKKLNTIRSAALKGSWQGSDSLFIKKNKKNYSGSLTKSDELKQKIIQAEREIHSLQQHIENYFMADILASKTFNDDIEKLKLNIVEWNKQLNDTQ